MYEYTHFGTRGDARKGAMKKQGNDIFFFTLETVTESILRQHLAQREGKEYKRRGGQREKWRAPYRPLLS